jgi:uncharacterized ubiquitin-like protein YukD
VTDPGQQTVNIRVQVIDMKSFTLDLQVPTYLPARDLTQRLARDAGLDAYWENGRRRLYWLRARGRLLTKDETLSDLGVVNGELVYLLPEPPHGSGVREQPPAYPPNAGYAGKGTANILVCIALVLIWALAWGAGLMADRNPWTVHLPGLGLGFLCLGLARHLWGGPSQQVRIVLTGLVLYVISSVLVYVPIVFGQEAFLDVFADSVTGLILGFVGVFMGWLAWWGAVEPLPPTDELSASEDQGDANVAVACGICAQNVGPDVRAECQYGCGQFFHSGCLQARIGVYRGDSRFCAVCNARIA